MANLKFSQLPASVTLADADILAVAVNLSTLPASHKITMSDFRAYLSGLLKNFTAPVTITGSLTTSTPEEMLTLFRPETPTVNLSSGYRVTLRTAGVANSTRVTFLARYNSGDNTSYQEVSHIESRNLNEILHVYSGDVYTTFQGLFTYTSGGIYALNLSTGSTFTANRRLDFNIGDADRILTLNNNIALNQDLETTDNVTFASMTAQGSLTTTSYETLATFVRPQNGGGNQQSVIRYNVRTGSVADSTQVQVEVGYGAGLYQEAYNIESKLVGDVTTTYTGIVNTPRHRIGPGTVSLPSLALQNYINTGFFENAANSIGISNNGQLTAKFQQDGFEYIQPQRFITASETIADDEFGTRIVVRAASAVDLTLPQQSTEAHVQGSFFDLLNLGPEDVTLFKQGTDVLRGNYILATGAQARVYLTEVNSGINYWDVVGGTKMLLSSYTRTLPTASNATYNYMIADRPGTLLAMYASSDASTRDLEVEINGTTVGGGTLSVGTSLVSKSFIGTRDFTTLDKLTVTITNTVASANVYVQLMYTYGMNTL